MRGSGCLEDSLRRTKSPRAANCHTIDRTKPWKHGDGRSLFGSDFSQALSVAVAFWRSWDPRVTYCLIAVNIIASIVYFAVAPSICFANLCWRAAATATAVGDSEDENRRKANLAGFFRMNSFFRGSCDAGLGCQYSSLVFFQMAGVEYIDVGLANRMANVVRGFDQPANQPAQLDKTLRILVRGIGFIIGIPAMIVKWLVFMLICLPIRLLTVNF